MDDRLPRLSRRTGGREQGDGQRGERGDGGGGLGARGEGGGDDIPMPKPKSEWVNSGRGLRIVRSLAHEWGVSYERNGRTVWASLGGPSRRRA